MVCLKEAEWTEIIFYILILFIKLFDCFKLYELFLDQFNIT